MRLEVVDISTVVNQCADIKTRQKVLKYGCAFNIKGVIERYINNHVRRNKKQHYMCCWFCGKFEHKKMDCIKSLESDEGIIHTE